MTRPLTLVSGQYGDIPLPELAALAAEIGYDGIETACWAHVLPRRVVDEPGYAEQIEQTLAGNGLKLWAMAAHLIGQCVGDNWDPRLDNFAPAELAGKPEEIRAWAIEEMCYVARAAQRLGVKVVTCFLGSPIWPYWYSFPQTTPEQVSAGFARIKELWSPIFDVYDECGVRLALEVHPTEIAFDYWSTVRLFEELDHRPTLGLNFDPSHLLWQGVDPVTFLHDFGDRIYHVHLKDVKLRRDGRAGLLGSHLDFGDTRRGWNFVSLGHGDVDFEGIVRELTQIGYDGPLSIEWEDSVIDRIDGARDAFGFASRLNYRVSTMKFDDALKVD
ncbi:MAG: sugar phosphate isomerase/epimerase family protein [Propionicimonas sp.]